MPAYDAIASMISKLGFPIFVATFLLLRVDKSLSRVLALLGELTIAVKILAKLEAEDGEISDSDDKEKE